MKESKLSRERTRVSRQWSWRRTMRLKRKIRWGEETEEREMSSRTRRLGDRSLRK